MKHPCRNSSVRHRTSHTMMTMIFTHYVALNNSMCSASCERCQRGTARILTSHAALLFAVQQSIHIFCRTGSQQQTCRSGFAAVDPFWDRQAEGRPACSTYYAGSANREQKCADTTGTVPVPWAGHFQIPTLKY